MEPVKHVRRRAYELITLNLLKHIHLEHCPRLEKLFPRCLPLPALETLVVPFCTNLKTIFHKEPDYEVAPSPLPNIRRIYLQELPQLEHIHDDAMFRFEMPNWEKLFVRGCRSFQRLSLLKMEHPKSKVRGQWRAWVVGKAAVEAARAEWLLFACGATKICVTQETYHRKLPQVISLVSDPGLCAKHTTNLPFPCIHCVASCFVIWVCSFSSNIVCHWTCHVCVGLLTWRLAYFGLFRLIPTYTTLFNLPAQRYFVYQPKKLMFGFVCFLIIGGFRFWWNQANGTCIYVIACSMKMYLTDLSKGHGYYHFGLI